MRPPTSAHSDQTRAAAPAGVPDSATRPLTPPLTARLGATADSRAGSSLAPPSTTTRPPASPRPACRHYGTPPTFPRRPHGESAPHWGRRSPPSRPSARALARRNPRAGETKGPAERDRGARDRATRGRREALNLHSSSVWGETISH